MAFSTQKEIFPSKKTLLWGYSVYNLHAMCVSPRRYDFVVKVIKNGREKSKIVWSAYNGYRMSQENVIK